ncbi:MAG: ABC transporter ATP-binding protein [Ktedonobacteraceae bacterium]|nr:ABC transporter ATP-binding protein [Ktedonobacteraceae bacterium]
MSLFSRLLAQPEPPHTLIAPDPRPQYLRSTRVLFLVWLVFLIALASAAGLMSIFNSISTVPWPLLAPAFMFLATIGFFSVIMYYWGRIEPRRFAAALGDQHLLANEQPQPDSDALRLPVTIAMNGIKEHRLYMGYMSFTILFLMVFIYVSGILFMSFTWLWSLLIAVLVGIFLFSCVVLVARQRYPIEVTDEGIKARAETGGKFMMFWHEMCLFARYPEPGPWNSSPAVIYELSSASHVIRWVWVRRKGPLNIVRGRHLSPGEYNAQMQALCALVAAKTGLPLYDLSKWRGK